MSIKLDQSRTISQAVEGKLRYFLILVVIVQFIYPITESGTIASYIAYQLLYFALIAVGIFVVRINKNLTRFMVVTSLIWVIAGNIYAFNQSAIWANLLAYSAIIGFQITVTLVLLQFIFTSRTVNQDVLYAAASVYLLLGGIFVPIYGTINSITYLQTGAHAFVDGTMELANPDIFPWQSFIYYSYVTLTTVGYGDILPVTMLARSVASLEAMIGVLYTTVIIARLVGIYAADDLEALRGEQTGESHIS